VLLVIGLAAGFTRVRTRVNSNADRRYSLGLMRTTHKLSAAVVILVASILLLRVDGWFGLGAVVALPLFILYWFDLGRELRAFASPSRFQRVAGLLMGVPQALFGMLCLVSGISIVIWVLYNSLWGHDPSYTGGFLTFGIGPLLGVVGLGLVLDAFRRSPR
jgi:hypothetical protein